MKIEDKIDQYLMQEEYDADKLARWANTFAKNHGGMTPDDKGWHEVCVEHMEGNVDDAPAYCARVRDAWKGSTYWRGKGKSEKEAKADVKKHQNITKGEREPKEPKGKSEE
jgi:hypothetical protein